MGITVISATPSPYARKVRISLHEKSIPFTLQTEVPWNSTTATPKHNPLEKLPVLIDDEPPSGSIDGASKSVSVYESHFIMEWLEAWYGTEQGYKGMLGDGRAEELFAKQVQVVADGMCDACVLMFFEKQRPDPSKEWMARQERKVNGGLRALSTWVGEKDFIIGKDLTLADIAAGTVLGYMKVRYPTQDWQKEYSNLKRYSDGLEKRESFKQTVPVAQTISDKIV